MQPLGSADKGKHLGKCTETSSKCVIWDGPDINCLGIELCAGQSIEYVFYYTAKTLCDLLDMLNISQNDLQCLTPFDDDGNINQAALPKNINELTQLIITKLCELDQEVIALQNTGTTPIYVDLLDCADSDIIANCPSGTTTEYTDANGNKVTRLLLISADGTTSPAVQYLVLLLCDLLCRMTTAESQIKKLRADVDNLLNQAAGALPSVVVPVCINNNTQPQSIIDPLDSSVGALPDMANLLCDIKKALVDSNSITTLTSYNINPNCGTLISTEAPLGVYPGFIPTPTTLEDLGAIQNATTLQEVLTNMWVAICDLRNFASIVKATCCPTLCAEVVFEVAAGLPAGDGSRNTLTVILQDTFVDYYGNSITANSSVPLPGFGVGPTAIPPTFNGVFPYTITITDESFNTYTYTGTDVSVLFLPSSSITVGPIIPTLNLLENWTLQFTSSIQAPDYTICNLDQTILIPAICDNQPLLNVTIPFVGFDGFTLQYTLPNTPSWPAAGTVATDYEYQIYDSGNVLIDSGFIDFANYTNQYLYFYADAVNILPVGDCVPSCPNFVQVNLQPNTSYYVKLRIKYNCGVSSWFTSSTFTTFVPVEITLKGSLASSCVLDGDFTLIPALGTPVGDISSNFGITLPFDSTQDVTITVYAKPAVEFGFILNTPYITDVLQAITPCDIIAGTRCWGPPSLYKYQSGGTAGLYFADLQKSYTDTGCYDYINCQISGDSTYLGYTGPTSIDNIVNGGGPATQPGNASTILDNTPTPVPSPTYYPLVIPTGYDPNVDPNPIQISINPLLHKLNNAASPNLKVIIKDTDGYLADNSLIYFPAPSIQNTGGVPLGAPITLTYNTKTLGWGVGNYLTAQSRPTSYTSDFTDNSPVTPAGGPVGVPVFLKIIIQKWNGTNYVTPANSVYYVTSDWLNAGLSNIGTTGFTMSGIGLQLRDKITIEWSSGVENNNQNPDYQAISGGPGASNNTYGKVTITQDPYPGVLGPLVACDTKGHPDYDLCKVGVPVFGAGCFLWGNTTYYPAAAANSSTNKIIEFVVTGDATIEWEISGSSLSC